MEIVEVLKKADLTQDLALEDLKKVAAICSRVSYPKDGVIFEEDSVGHQLYVVEKGRVRIKIRLGADTDRQEVIHTLRSYETFGELSFIDGSPRSATIEAVDDVSLLVIEDKGLYQILDKNPSVGYIIMKNLVGIEAARLRNTNMLFRSSIIW
ncbi:cyclic nucleotide-binding domain-containing protein [candidate division KSB1 bacterium]|nr:cyclic nucleotide-binding domain-containing protein [candidate division KSB1 bacterium]